MSESAGVVRLSQFYLCFLNYLMMSRYRGMLHCVIYILPQGVTVCCHFKQKETKESPPKL